MLKKILIGFALLVAALVVLVMVQPTAYHVERSTQINAPAASVWAQINDFSQWKNWSHWETSDPSQKTTITGEPGTVGHESSWVGDKTGTGTMTASEVTAPIHLKIHMVFLEPMASESDATFVLVEKDGGVHVTWSLDGENDFMGKFFELVVGMDGMLGPAFEDGLANIKTLAEQDAAAGA